MWLAPLLLAGIPIRSTSTGGQPLDTLDFGSAASMASHGALARNATTVAGMGLGADKGVAFTPFWQPPPVPAPRGYRPQPGTGWIKFRMRVDPDPAATNYITVKLWGRGCGVGGNGSVCITQLHKPELLKPTMGIDDFEASQIAASQEGHATADNPNPCTLDFSTQGGSDTVKASGPAPGLYQYSTYILPRSLTAAAVNGSVTLAIGSGTYQTYGAPSLVRSRSLFKAFTHSGSGWLDLSGEAAGVPPPPSPPLPAANSTTAAAVAHLRTEIAAALAEVGSWQNWGPRFEQAVQAGKNDALFRGVPTAGSCGGGVAPKGKTGYIYCIDRKNLSPMRQLEIYAVAWNSTQPWAAGWSGNATVLHRIAAALDFFTKAQGANGGFNCAYGCYNFTPGTLVNGTAVAGGCSAGIPGLLDQGYYCNTQDESRHPRPGRTPATISGSAAGPAGSAVMRRRSWKDTATWGCRER